MNQLFRTVSGVGEHGGKTFWFKRLSVDEYFFFDRMLMNTLPAWSAELKKKATHSVPDYKIFFIKSFVFIRYIDIKYI